jgi:hypothetical protein
VLVLRAAFHPNVGVKRLGLSGLFQLSTSTLWDLMTNQGAWPALQELLLQLLPAFSDRKLVSPAAGGSASSKQAGAVAALQQQLAGFISSCVQILQAASAAGQGTCSDGRQQQEQRQQQQDQRQQQQEQRQQQLGLGPLRPGVVQLLLRYLEQAVTSSDTAATLQFLLQAVADGLTSAARDSPVAATVLTGDARPDTFASTIISSPQSPNSSSTNASSSSSSELLQAFTRVLAHAEFVHPAYVRPDICRTVLQLVGYCLQDQPVGPAAVLSLLAACSPLIVHATASPSSIAGVQQQQQWQHASTMKVHQHMQIFAADGFLQWLQAALTGPSNSQYSSKVQGVLAGSTGGTVSIQQQYTALYCLGMLVFDLGPQLQEQLVQAVHMTVHQVLQQTDQQAGLPAGAGWQQQQQQQQLTAAAWLIAGAAAAALANTLAAGSIGSCGTLQPPQLQQQQQMLVSCVADVLPQLLRHHLAANTPPQVAAYDTDWCPALAAAVSAAAAAAASQLGRIVCSELSDWCAHLESWLLAAVEPEVSLQQQLQLLTVAQIACFGMLHSSTDPTCTRSRHESSSAAAPNAPGVREACKNSSGQHRTLSGDQLDSCLLLLCKIAPSSTIGNGNDRSSASSNSSSSLSKSELTDKMLQLHAAVLDQCVTAAAAQGALTQDTREWVFKR